MNINVQNTLDKPIVLSWKPAVDVTDFKLYSTETPIVIGANSNKKITISFGAPSGHDLPTKDVMNVYAALQQGQENLLVNNKQFEVGKLSSTKDGDFMNFAVTQPKGELFLVI